MIGLYNVEKINSLIKDIYNVVGIRISIFNDEFNVVTEYPETAPKICSLIRSVPEGAAACRDCDIAACTRAKKLLQPHVYQCHAGITEAITPLQFEGGILGYAIFAHMMPSDGFEEAAEGVVEKVKKLGFDETEIRGCVNEINRYENEKIMASIKLLDAIAYYLQIQKAAVWKTDGLSSGLKTYIEANLNGNLDADTLCRTFYVSRTKLYQVSLSTFGIGISEYIASRRLKKACELLSSTSLPVYEIARRTGYDYNYFCKMFKKNQGISPLTYRRNRI